MKTDQPLFDLLHTDEAVPEAAGILTWPPGELYRIDCGCILHVKPDGTMRLILCNALCSSASRMQFVCNSDGQPEVHMGR